METADRGRGGGSAGIPRTAGAAIAALLVALIPAAASAQSGELLPADLQGIPAWLRVTHVVSFTGQWQRLVPTSWSVFAGAWDTGLRYIRLNFHSDPDPYYYGCNGLQQLPYFAVVFILAPLALLTGAAMSPAMAARFPWYPRLFGNR